MQNRLSGVRTWVGKMRTPGRTSWTPWTKTHRKKSMRSRPNKKPQYEVLLRRQRLPAEPPLLGLDEVRRVGEQRVAAAVVEMEVRVDHDVHVVDRPAHVLAQRPVEALLRRLGTGADVVVDPGAVMNAGIDQDLLRAAADGGAPERRIDGLPIPAAQEPWSSARSSSSRPGWPSRYSWGCTCRLVPEPRRGRLRPMECGHEGQYRAHAARRLASCKVSSLSLCGFGRQPRPGVMGACAIDGPASTRSGSARSST